MADVITQGMTLCNTNNLNAEQLKAELERVQKQSLQMGLALHNLNVIVHEQADVMAHLVDAHERGDTGAVSLKLQELSDWRKAREKRQTPH